MRADLVTWSRLVRAGFRRQSSYRLAMVAGLFTNVVFGFIRASILFAALDSAGGTLAGYDQGSISAYVWLSQGLLGAIQLNGAADVGDRVRTGDIAVDFTRPVDLQTWHLAEDLGRAAYTLIPRGVPSVLVGALTVGLTLPATAWPYLLGALSIVLGVAALLLLPVRRQRARLLAARHPGTAHALHGRQHVPGRACTSPSRCSRAWLHTLAYATPFPSILQVPIDVFSGRVVGAAGGQRRCAAVLLGRGGVPRGRACSRRRARRKLVVQGG